MQPTKRCKLKSMPLNVSRYWQRSASGSNAAMLIARFAEHQTGQSGRCECIRSMAEDRTRELEKALKLD